ncbi:MAG: RDD family protein, partial [Candidatus Heimdallarchaeota archaeon]
GDLSAFPPENVSFVSWDATGNEDNPLLWGPKEGTWTLILMKADGTANLDVSVSAGAKIPLLNIVAIFLIVIGLIFIILAIILFILAARSSKRNVVRMPYYGAPPAQASQKTLPSTQSTTQQSQSVYGTPAPKVSQPEIGLSQDTHDYPVSSEDETVYIIADYSPRIVAFIIDALVVSFFVEFFRWPILFSNPENSFFLFPATFSLNGIGLFLYFVILEGKYGTTLGKQIMKLQVLTESGEQPDLADIAKSALGKAFFIPIDFIVGLIMANDKSEQVNLNQRLMQRVSKTLVIVKPPKEIRPRVQFTKKL